MDPLQKVLRKARGYALYEPDLELLEQLWDKCINSGGFAQHECGEPSKLDLPHAVETPIFTGEFRWSPQKPAWRVTLSVIAWPAQFWRADVRNLAENIHHTISFGSGRLVDKWPIIEELAIGGFSCSRIAP